MKKAGIPEDFPMIGADLPRDKGHAAGQSGVRRRLSAANEKTFCGE
jgi:hypothetical protein